MSDQIAEPIRPGHHVTTVRRSRIRRTCEDCRQQILVGDTYARLSLPPSAEFSSGRWWSVDVHLVCPEPGALFFRVGAIPATIQTAKDAPKQPGSRTEPDSAG
jgi:hypothetical protein